MVAPANPGTVFFELGQVPKKLSIKGVRPQDTFEVLDLEDLKVTIKVFGKEYKLSRSCGTLKVK